MDDRPFPREPEGLTAEWLSEALGFAVRGFDAEQFAVGVGLLGRLYRIILDADGGPRSVVAKFPTLDRTARVNVCEAQNFYEKEVRFYQQVGADNPLRAPHCYFAAFDEATHDFVLLLEDLDSLRLADQVAGCSIEDAEVVIDGIADHHAHWWESNRFESMPWLYRPADPPVPETLVAMFEGAWPRFLEGVEGHISDDLRRFGERFSDLVPWFMEEQSRPPLTFLHGDLRLDQLFFGVGERDAPVTAVDWQITARGRGGCDVAFFLSQSLATSTRRAHEERLVVRYHERLHAAGVDYPLDELWNDYRRTVAFCFCYPVVGAGQIDLANERQRDLLARMLEGAAVAIDDHDALDLLPA